MAVQVWDAVTFLSKTREEAGDDHAWFKSVIELYHRANHRGDGIAIYTNEDLGHPDIGQWQVMSFGGPEAQLETRGLEAPTLETLPLGARRFTHGDDVIPLQLPDIGGRINWRYLLEAIVPPNVQEPKTLSDALDKAIAEENENPKGLDAETIAALDQIVVGEVPCEVEGCVYRKGHDLDTFPHRVERIDIPQTFVTVTVRVFGINGVGPNAEEAVAIAKAAAENGIDVWHDSAGQCGFSDQDDTGIDTYDRGIRAEVTNTVVG